ncbi:nucleoside hydrolase [Oceanispirochaeta crateris]|uniref:Nucleoside hydrolase n=1 Tax=Oceanispirochaeta crateris TaxID=2518645 RepID=A0A5C1QI87_9SPIO|nr:nucleoside hydrolase [Oceanispirochaeta crateris]
MDVKELIIDCDPGIDDALALFMAFASDKLLVRGITTVAGNVSSALTARNALSLCTLAGQDIEVASGASGPLVGTTHTAANVHGENGLGNVNLPVAGGISERGAEELLYQELLRAGGDLEIIALGPLTNIALLIEKHPDVLPYIKKLTIMGGSLGRGNVTPHGEFNFYSDPLAADRVLRSGIPIHLVGLDVTNQALLHGEDIDKMEAWGGPVISDVVKMIRYYQRFYRSMGLDGLKMHDPLAVAAVIDPTLTETTAYALRVEHNDQETMGKVCIIDESQWGNAQLFKNVSVSMRVNQDRFLSLFMRLMRSFS